MHAFMYIDPENIIEEDYFPATKVFFLRIKKVQLLNHPQTIGLVSVTFSEYYELDMKFDEPEIKWKPDSLQNKRDKSFFKNIEVAEE